MKHLYKHLLQKPSMCGPACIQMVLLRKGMWMDQEEIAEKVNARIFADQKDFFSKKLRITKDDIEVGIRLREFGEERIRNFFKNLKPSLKTEIFQVSEIKEVKDFIKENLNKNNDIIANIHMRYFDKKRKFGHFVLVSEIKGDRVTLCDPSPNSQNLWITTIDKLVKSMSKKIDGLERGFAIIS